MSSMIIVAAFTMLLASSLLKLFPPKKINWFYGYRTPRSIKNQDTWDEANKLSTNGLFTLSIVFIVILLLSTFLIGEQLALPISITSYVISIIILIISIEVRLSRTFDKEGNRKSSRS